MVNVVNDSWEVVTCRSRDNHLLCTSLNVCRSLLLRSVETSALEHNINTKLTPRKLSCVWLSVDSDFLTINDDRVVCCFNSVLTFTELASETTLCSVILEEVSKHLWACQVIDSDYFITFSLEHLTESEATNTAKAVNSYFCH